MSSPLRKRQVAKDTMTNGDRDGDAHHDDGDSTDVRPATVDQGLRSEVIGSSQGRRPLSVLWGLLKVFLVFTILILLIVNVISPLVWYNVPIIRRLLLFMNYVNVANKDLSNPGAFGLNCTRHFFIHHGREGSPSWTDDDEVNPIGASLDGHRVGAWHILPSSRLSSCEVTRQDPTAERVYFDAKDGANAFQDDHPVILYLHGNGGARGGRHRVELYKLLAYNPKINAHILTVDYRGYGDSTDVWPARDTMTEDAALAYRWLLETAHVSPERIIVWGHSLGTAVAVRFLAQLLTTSGDTSLSSRVPAPAGLVLEAPFSSIEDAFRSHPLSLPFRAMNPYFEDFFVAPMVQSEVTNFNTHELIGQLTPHIPILILHAEDDVIIPIGLGRKLYEIALRHHSEALKAQNRTMTADNHLTQPQMLTFDASLRYGHKHICRDPQLPDYLKYFFKRVRGLAAETT